MVFWKAKYNSIAPITRHFFRPRPKAEDEKKCRGWGGLLFYIARQNTIYIYYISCFFRSQSSIEIQPSKLEHSKTTKVNNAVNNFQFIESFVLFVVVKWVRIVGSNVSYRRLLHLKWFWIWYSRRRRSTTNECSF